MSPYLREFLEQWIEWADGAASTPADRFRADFGLCACLNRWADWADLPFNQYEELAKELTELFSRSRRSRVAPFNDSYLDFLREDDKRKNEARLDWVRRVLR